MRFPWYALLALCGSFLSCNDETAKPVTAATAGYPDMPPAKVKAVDIPDKDYHIVTTPNGGHFHLLLPDSSEVWLNAASSITYPNQFTAHERKVSITGEAYFEIRHSDTSRFVVDFDAGPVGQCGSVEVVGTRFNINAYPNEPVAITTLFEGKVRMAAQSNLQSAILKPGEQAALQNDKAPIIVWKGDTTHTWKKGWFRFERNYLPVFCRDLERWYDIRVHLDGKHPKKEPSGFMQRNTSLATIVKTLESAGLSSTFKDGALYIHN